MFNYSAYLENFKKVNRRLRTDSGLYVASLGDHYVNFCWLRDIFYQALPEIDERPEFYEQTYQTLLDYLIGLEKNYDNKISWLIHEGQKNVNTKTFIHPRFHKDLTEITDKWGNVQFDALGCFMFGLGLGLEKGIEIVRDKEDIKIINKLIHALETTKYWETPDNGIWEENSEVHASSIGACVAGLKKLEELSFQIPEGLIEKGEAALNELLPRESITKEVDLALLTLIYPFDVVTKKQKNLILRNVEDKLLKSRGVIRYKGDRYYNIANPETMHNYGGVYMRNLGGVMEGNELEWTFGLSYLSIIASYDGNIKASKMYLDRLISSVNATDYFIPEGFYAKTAIENCNNPLGWSMALAIEAIKEHETASKFNKLKEQGTLETA